MLSIGDSKVSKLYLGDTECKKAYLGDTLVIDNSKPVASNTLNDNSWQTIADITASGKAQDYWKVGDTKSITLNGTVGTLPLNNFSIDAFIIGFDHNQDLESPGEHRIHWGIGKISKTLVALVDSKYNSDSTSGQKYFNMNHSGNANYGGWAGCDLRYDILGSTNIPPKGYGNVPKSGRVGYDPSNYDIVINPVANTLISALPVDLRKVMKTVTKYTDNVAGGNGSKESSVTPSIDYISVLSEYEVYASTIYANSYEKNYQLQYDYFINSNKTIYNHNNIFTSVMWPIRSVSCIGSTGFVAGGTNGSVYGCRVSSSGGIFPIFFT